MIIIIRYYIRRFYTWPLEGLAAGWTVSVLRRAKGEVDARLDGARTDGSVGVQCSAASGAKSWRCACGNRCSRGRNCCWNRNCWKTASTRLVSVNTSKKPESLTTMAAASPIGCTTSQKTSTQEWRLHPDATFALQPSNSKIGLRQIQLENTNSKSSVRPEGCIRMQPSQV